ncbi:hypothetical protein [Bradyrhizobium sp. URHD0069]|uniref:hypothetical protein n=1 Tax=Bradyrhizobium sp. URHD0069 TaxID=1380355 RepID=UPI0004981012|nr:hypothetical protein [Bradyrhizobium sp. URHD0069]
MRRTEARGWMEQTSSRTLSRAVRLAVVALGIGLVMTAGAARAQEDDEDDKTFEEKIIEGIMAGLGGTNMENRGIDYRERSPLVVPPKLDLPPPASAAEVKAPNWPKDPDESRRKAAIAARKKDNKDPREASRILTPSELNKRAPKASSTADSDSVAQPGGNPGATAILSPSQLGYSGGFSSMFGGNKSETAPFKGEPTRESLTQPPTGYQTPSPNYAYGTGPKESLNKEYNPAAGKYGE